MYEYKRGKYRLRKRIGLLLFCVLITAFLSSCSLFMPTFSDLSDSTHVSTDVSDATPTPTMEPNAYQAQNTTPIPTQEPTAISTPIPAEDSFTMPIPEGEPTSTPIPTKEPTTTPIPAEDPTTTPIPSKKPTSAPTPTKAPNTVPTTPPVQDAKPTTKPKPTPTPKPEANSSDYRQMALNIIKKIITQDMEDVEKIKAVHDYIVVNTKYDMEAIKQKNIPDYVYSVEGVLVKGKAVCQGYAETFQLFMELLNIESRIVVGTELLSNIGHAWNMVCLNDKWYHIDVTWDDPVPDQGESIRYKYFLIRDVDIDDDHQWNKSDYPKCDSSDYLYYIYKDYIVDSIDNVEAKFMEQYDMGLRRITILYPEEGMPDFTFMQKYDYLWKIVDGVKTINYSYYPIWSLGDYYVLTVIME